MIALKDCKKNDLFILIEELKAISELRFLLMRFLFGFEIENELLVILNKNIIRLEKREKIVLKEMEQLLN